MLLQALRAGEHDRTLAGLYALDGAQSSLDSARERAIHVVERFQTCFAPDDNVQVALFSGPGRTEIGGNHTDHQHGHVLCGSVDLDMLACAAANGLRVIRIFSEGYPALKVDLDRLFPQEGEVNTSAALVRGVAAKVQELGYPVTGFDAYMTSTVLSGSGLSSSAAYEVLVGAGPCSNRQDRPVRRERLFRQALRPDGSDGLLRGRGRGHRLCRPRCSGGEEG